MESNTKEDNEQKEFTVLGISIPNWINLNLGKHWPFNKEESMREQIIKNVNMNLDLTHYEDKIPARNQNNKLILVNKYYYLEEDYVPANLEELSNQYALNNMQMVAK